MEHWIAIDFAPDYEVSSHGRVRRATHGRGTWPGRIIKHHLDSHGYPALHVSNQGDWFRVKVHILVCTAFHGPRPEGADAAHFDGVRSNNTAENLRWASRKENMADAIRHSSLNPVLGSKNANSILTEEAVVDIRSRPGYKGVLFELSREYGISRNVVGNIRTRKSGCWPHIPFPD